MTVTPAPALTNIFTTSSAPEQEAKCRGERLPLLVSVSMSAPASMKTRHTAVSTHMAGKSLAAEALPGPPNSTQAPLLQTDFQYCKRSSVHATFNALFSHERNGRLSTRCFRTNKTDALQRAVFARPKRTPFNALFSCERNGRLSTRCFRTNKTDAFQRAVFVRTKRTLFNALFSH